VDFVCDNFRLTQYKDGYKLNAGECQDRCTYYNKANNLASCDNFRDCYIDNVRGYYKEAGSCKYTIV
jgi:hypothetical protein